MKNYKKKNAGFVPRIFTIALVTMLTVTTLWAKPKIEYSPFKSENPNATVFECEYIEGCSRIRLYYSTSGEFKGSPIAIYGWKKKKGGWEKLKEYQSTFFDYETILGDDCDKYTHYAVEFEAPENTMTLSAKKGDYSAMDIILTLSEDYKKLLSEKRAAERAEQERLEAEKEAKRNAEIDAKAKAIAKGYVYHGIDEVDRNRKLFTGGALEEGHAYYVSGFVVKYGGTKAAIEYADGFFFSSRSSAVSVDYVDQKVKGEIVEASITTIFGKTIEDPLAVVIVGGKAPLHTPVVIGLVK